MDETVNEDVEFDKRVEALKVAGTVLRSGQPLSSKPGDASDLIRVAEWVLTGKDPWSEEARVVVGAGLEPGDVVNEFYVGVGAVPASDKVCAIPSCGCNGEESHA